MSANTGYHITHVYVDSADQGTTTTYTFTNVTANHTISVTSAANGSDLTVTGNLTVNGNTTADSDLTVLGNGKIHLGTGTGSPDTLLWRTNPSELSITNNAGSAYGNLSVQDIIINGAGKIQILPDVKISRTDNNEVSLQNLVSGYADLKLNNITAIGNSTVLGNATVSGNATFAGNVMATGNLEGKTNLTASKKLTLKDPADGTGSAATATIYNGKYRSQRNFWRVRIHHANCSH